MISAEKRETAISQIAFALDPHNRELGRARAEAVVIAMIELFEKPKREKAVEPKGFADEWRVLYGEEISPIMVTAMKPVTHKAQLAWIGLYGAHRAWMAMELGKAYGWIQSNPQKAPKTNLARFYNSWLSRAWEDYRQSIAGKPPAAAPIKACDECAGKGCFNVRVKSTGCSEWVSCSCAKGRSLTRYTRFDASKHER